MDIGLTTLVGWFVIGIAAGWLVGRVARNGLGPIGHMVIGIMGACIGGYVLPQYGYLPEGTGGALIAGGIGAIFLLTLNTVIASAFSS